MPSSSPSVTDAAADVRRLDRRNLILCAVLPLAALAVAWPVAEVGIHDDAAYIHMAKTLAATGRFAYNGWAAMTLGLQVWWAAAWIKLVGFSFTATRLSLLPLVLAVPPLIYLTARRAGLSTDDSLFAALLTAAQEEFFDHAPIFMTDVSSLCLLLASLLAFARAVETADGGRTFLRVLGWLLLGMACGALGGTIRQSVWFALIAGPAVLLLRPGADGSARLAGGGCMGVGAACLVLGIRWFNAQPYTLPSASALGVTEMRQLLGGVPKLLSAALVGCILPCMTAVAFCLPALNIRTRPRGAVSAAALVSAVTCLWLQRRPLWRAGVAIADGNLLDAVAAGSDAATGILGYLRLLALLLLILLVAQDALRPRATLPSALRTLPPTILVGLAYAALYCMALGPASLTTGAVFPRYFWIMVPLLTSCILYWSQHRRGPHAMRQPRAAWAWACVACTGVYAVMVSHDLFASTKLRAEAIRHLETRGVPRDRISAGWEIDHWEQIDRAGHLNERRIRTPAGAWHPLPADGYPLVDGRERTDLITPEYIIDGEPPHYPGDDSGFPTFSRPAWLPRNRGRITITIQHQRPSSPTGRHADGTTGIKP